MRYGEILHEPKVSEMSHSISSATSEVSYLSIHTYMGAMAMYKLI